MRIRRLPFIGVLLGAVLAMAAALLTITPASADTPEPQIVGGNVTTGDKHPWLVQIMLDGQAFCGGVLIHPRIVLTAAHCLLRADGSWYHQFGTMEAFMGRTNSGVGGVQLPIDPSRSRVTGNWNRSLLTNDFGYLVLTAPTSQPQLKIAGPDERALWKANAPAQVAGFGATAWQGPSSPVLKEVGVKIVGDSTCAQPSVYGTWLLTGTMLCAGVMAGGHGTCQGDSGGPLTVLGDRGIRRVVGLVSWAVECAKAGMPTVYTRVAERDMSATIASHVAAIEKQDGFTGASAGVKVVGSGAKPVGCTAATAAATKATTAKKKAATAHKKAKKALTKAKKALAKSTSSAKKKKAVAQAKKKVAKTKRKLKTATTKATAATKKARATCS